MPKYEVKYIKNRKTNVIVIDAASEEKLKRSFTKKGQKIISLKKKSSIDFSFGLTPDERYTFLTRLSSMVGSKLGTSQALRIMAENFTGNIKKVSSKLLNQIETGTDLATAIEMDRKNFPVMTVAMVKAGLSSGETWKALKDAAEFEYEMRNMTKESAKGMWAAVGSFFLAGAMMISTTEYFGPKVQSNSLFKSIQDQINVEWVHTVGTISTQIMVVLMSIIILLFLLGTVGKRILPNIADGVILRIPFYKDLVLAKNNYVTLYKLSLLIKAGVRVEEALRLTHESAQPGALRTDIYRAMMAVKSGKQEWAKTMKTLHPTDKAAIAASNDKTEIARTLNMLSQQYKSLYIQRMNTIGPTMKLISVLFLSIAGGVLFGETILPMLQAASAFSR